MGIVGHAVNAAGCIASARVDMKDVYKTVPEIIGSGAMHPGGLAIELPSAPPLVTLSFGVHYRHDVLLRGSARYTPAGNKARPPASVFASGWGGLSCANDDHRQCCAGPAVRPGFTKFSTVDSAWPLLKDCRTSNMLGRLQVRSIARDLPLSDCDRFALRATANFCVTAEFPRQCCACQALPEPPAAGPAGPNTRLLKPQLQKQWHHANNQHLGSIQISTSSNRRVWWTCDQCPCGLPHEWLATINSRQCMNTQCPFCTNRKLCHHNSLLTVAPSVASYWDTAKNGVTADQVLAGSGTRRHWLCPTCSHSWQAQIDRRATNDAGCPICSMKSKGHTRQPTLTARNHPVMVEFDHSRNQEAGLDPDKLTLGSNKKVHWTCSNCPRGQPHLYMASPDQRIGRKSGCPYCSSKLACICNSLQALYPAIAAEWDTARNGVGPDQILPGSKKSACWKNAEGHSWEQSPFQRTRLPVQHAKRAMFKAKLNN